MTKESTTDESIIYPAQPIPPEGPGGRKRSAGALVAGALAIMLILGATAFAVNVFSSDDPAADTEPTQTTLPGETTTTIASDRDSRVIGEDGALSAPDRPRAVGTPTPALPTTEFTWQQVELPGGTGSYLNSLQWVGDRFIALGNTWDGNRSTVSAWQSPDGFNWTTLELNGDFADASVWQIRMNEHGGIALGDQFQEYVGDGLTEDAYFYENNQVLIWTTTDGQKWNRWEVELGLDGSQSYWVSSAGVGPTGFVALVHSNPAYRPDPIELSFEGLTVTLNEFDYTYTVTNASGAVLAEGSQNDLYGYREQNGQAVWDSETGDLIVVVPYDKWEEAYSRAYNTGGPFGGYVGHPVEVVIEHDGWRVSLDEEAYEFTVENIATGEIVTAGSMDYLYRGPNPEIYDAAGNLILAVTWSDWDRAMDRHWQTQTEPDAYQGKIHAVASADGITWESRVLNIQGGEFYLDSILATEDGFIAFGSSYDEFGGGPEIWTSGNGLDWKKEADVPGGMYLWNVNRGADGRFLSLGDSVYGNAVWGSSDGISWGEVLGTRIPEDRNKQEWFNLVSSGELGTFVLGSRETFYGTDGEYRPMTLTADGHTLTFEDQEWPPTVTVTDSSGAVLVKFQLNETGETPHVAYDTSTRTTTISDSAGNVVFTFTDDEFHRAQDARWGATEAINEAPIPTMYFSTDLEEWSEVILDERMHNSYLNQMAVGLDTVVISGQEHYKGLDYEEGAPVDEELFYEEPPVVLFVGRR